jgi:hypothetical protein
MNTTQMEVRVYLSTNSSFDLAIDLGRDPLVWRLSNLGLSPSEDNDRAIELNYTLPPDLKVYPTVQSSYSTVPRLLSYPTRRSLPNIAQYYFSFASDFLSP